MKLKTHYLKQQSNSKLGNRMESLIYQAIPEDELCTSTNVYSKAFLLFEEDEDGTPLPSLKTVENVLKFFVEQGFVKEFTGPRLAKLLA